MKLVISKIIAASAESLFAAWTQPEQLRQWWGPESVTCIGAELDVRVGGRYRIGNRFPDGRVLWITGEFHLIEAPNKLVYSWRVGTDSNEELVTVSFHPIEDGKTEVTITHERIPDRTARDSHEHGWLGCLGKLASYLS